MVLLSDLPVDALTEFWMKGTMVFEVGEGRGDVEWPGVDSGSWRNVPVDVPSSGGPDRI